MTTSVLFLDGELHKLWHEGEKWLREIERQEEAARQAKLRAARIKASEEYAQFVNELVKNGLPAAFQRYSDLNAQLEQQLASENPVGPEPYHFAFNVEFGGIVPIRVRTVNRRAPTSEDDEKREWAVEEYRVAAAHLETQSASEALAVARRAWHEQNKEALEDDAEVDA